MADLNRQLSGSKQVPESCDFEVNTPQTGHREVCSALLNLNLGEILLCQHGGEFAVIERFHEQRPGEVVAPISERCHQAITNMETISQTQEVRQTVSRGISI